MGDKEVQAVPGVWPFHGFHGPLILAVVAENQGIKSSTTPSKRRQNEDQESPCKRESRLNQLLNIVPIAYDGILFFFIYCIYKNNDFISVS